MGTADLHVHTDHSYDGTASVRSVLAAAKNARLDLLAITDHDTISGALEAVAMSADFGVTVIPGVEITTAEGDLLALNIRTLVPAKLTLTETVHRVADLGGFCVAAHPMSGGFGMKSLSHYSIIRALKDPIVQNTLIGIETYNATAIDQDANKSADLLAGLVKVAKTGSSDAHVAQAIGCGRTRFQGHTLEDLLIALRNRQTEPVLGERWGSQRVLTSWVGAYLRNSINKSFSLSQGVRLWK